MSVRRGSAWVAVPWIGLVTAVLLAAAPALAAEHVVVTELQLRTALTAASDGDTITFGGDITLTADLPAVQRNVTIRSQVGAVHVLDGAGQFRGFLVGRWTPGTATQVAVSVTIQDLRIQNARAVGGSAPAARHGGGGAGLGGALFVADLATATLSNVELDTNNATGGAGGQFLGFAGGGGGGMGGKGSDSAQGGGGGVGVGADGGASEGGAGSAGIVTGAAPGGAGNLGGSGGINGGGGGAGGETGGGGGVGGATTSGVGGTGGFGGGGGSGDIGGPGGFGGGGGGGISDLGGNGGFGGGGGGDAGDGGFGGGNGGGGGGGGAGLGGALFVQQGGSLVVNGTLTVTGNSVDFGAGGGFGATDGSAFGTGLFLQGNDAGNAGSGSLTFAPGSGETQTVSDEIADQTGNGGTGRWGLTKTGAGTLVLGGTNTYTGATTVSGGTLLVTGSLDSRSDVTVASGATLGGTGTMGGDVTLQLGGRFVPGTSIGILAVGGDFTWHGATTGTATALFELGNSDATSDQLAVTGALLKGSGSTFRFDFQGTGHAASYVVATFLSSTFSALDFTYTNLAPGLRGQFVTGGGALNVLTTPLPAAKHDLTGDAKADIVWRETVAGYVAAWAMNGPSLAGSTLITTLDSSWTAVAVGDFDNDGNADILWRNAAGGVAVWLLNGTAVSTYGPITAVSLDWSIAGVGDFNGDGRTDILWRNTNTGKVAIWLMNGTLPSTTALPGVAGSSWEVAGVGDFLGGGRAGILWRDTASGAARIWFLTVDATAIDASVGIGTASAAWTIVGVGDVNGDSIADVLWREAGGDLAIWLVRDALVHPRSVTNVATDWTVAGVQDFDRDGRADILWRHAGGDVAVWLMNGHTVEAAGLIPGVPTTWVPR